MDETTAPDATPASGDATPPDPVDTTPAAAAGQAPAGDPSGTEPTPAGAAPGPQGHTSGPQDHAPGPQGYTPGPRGYAPQPVPSGMDNFFSSVRRTGLVRTDERWVGGVAGGLALRMGIDPLIVRGLLGVSVLLGGLGLVIYGVGWLLLPEQRDGRIHLQQLFRGDFDAAVIGGFALMLTGFAFPNRWTPFLGWGDGSTNRWGGFIGFIAIVVIIAVIASSTAKNRSAGPTTPLPRPGPPSAPTYPAGGSPAGYATAPVPPVAGQRPPEGFPMYPAPPAASPHAAPVHYGPVPPHVARPMLPPPIRPPFGPQTALPPRPSHRGPGGRAVGIVVALSLLALAGLLYAERLDSFDGPVLLTAAAVLVVLSGIGVVVAGLLGRSGGGLSAVAIITILVVAPIAAASDISWSSTTNFVGDVTYVPQDAETAEGGYSVGVGNFTLDLTDLPTAGPAVEVPVHLGAGDLQVILPEDGAYTARVRLMAGQVIWLDDTVMDGVSNREWQILESPAVQDGAAPDVELEITVGAGSLRVLEESR